MTTQLQYTNKNRGTVQSRCERTSDAALIEPTHTPLFWQPAFLEAVYEDHDGVIGCIMRKSVETNVAVAQI